MASSKFTSIVSQISSSHYLVWFWGKYGQLLCISKVQWEQDYLPGVLCRWCLFCIRNTDTLRLFSGVSFGYHKRSYIEIALARFGMKDCYLGDTPIIEGDKFSLSQYPKNKVKKKEMQKIPYASVVESLMYDQVCTHPNLTFMIGILGRYLSNPRMDLQKIAKWVI